MLKVGIVGLGGRMGHALWDCCLGLDTLTVFTDKENKRGYLNTKTGKIALPAQWDHAWVFSEGVGDGAARHHFLPLRCDLHVGPEIGAEFARTLLWRNSCRRGWRVQQEIRAAPTLEQATFSM